MENNIRPTVLSSIKELERQGLTYDHIVTLIHKKVGHSKINRTQVKLCLDALIKLEEEIIKNYLKHNELPGVPNSE